MKKIDKRTKEWKESQKALEMISKATGITSQLTPNELKEQIDTNIPKELEIPSQGLGDTIEKVLKVTGVKKLVDVFTDGKDCKCADRRKKLNEVFSYKAQCLEQKEYDYIKKYNERHDPTNFSKEDVFQLGRIHQRVFKVRISVCKGCSSGVKSMNIIVGNLNKMITLYEEG